MSSHDTTEDKEKLEKLEALFFRVLDQPVSQRASFMGRVCGEDQQLRESLEKMLRADQEQEGLIDTAPWSVQQIGRRLTPDDAADPLAQPGAKIGRYELVKRLGAGGMGTVWLARQADGLVDRTVAMKLIRRGMDTEDILRRFRLERQVLSTLEHPYIGRLYDAGADESGRPFLVMEYVQGMPLHEYCSRNECTVDQRLELFRKVAAAVHYAHNNLVLHRDLKPGNILVTPDGTPKLLDFGIARLLGDDGAAITSITGTDSRIFTPRYASPEQIRRDRLTTASDVYSLGLLLYELLTNRSPYDVEDGSRAAYERAVLTNRIRKTTNQLLELTVYRPAERRRLLVGLRSDLGAIIRKAMAPAAVDRYGSAEQLAEDVRRHQEGLPLLARRAGMLRLGVRMLRRNRRSLVVAMVAALLALAATGTALTYWFMAPSWALDHVRDAHLTLLDPSYLSNSVWNVVFYGTDNWERSGGRPEVNLHAARETVSAYESALRLDSHNNRVRQEAETLRLAMALATEPHTDPNTSIWFRQAAPLTCRFAAKWMADGVVPKVTEDELDTAAAGDLRSLGLLTMSCGDIATTLRVWSRLGGLEADPLIEALLGVLYLAIDQPELAYPRLLSSYRQYPESGVLCTYLADAAVQCGDLALAARLLERSESLENSDGYGALPRVRMLYHLAAGQEDLADETFKSHKFVVSNPVATVQYARYLAARGEFRKALAVFVPECGLYSTPVIARRKLDIFVDLAERWWAGLDEADRSDVVSSTLAGSYPRDPDSFVALLRAFRLSVLRLETCPTQDDVPWSQATTHAPMESQALARQELLVLYDRMGIDDHYRWAHIAEYPPPQNSLQTPAWTSPTPLWFVHPVAEVREDGRDPINSHSDPSMPYQKLLPSSRRGDLAGSVVDVETDNAMVCSQTGVFVYHRMADGWTLEQQMTFSAGVLEGALDGNRLLIAHQDPEARCWEAFVWERSSEDPRWQMVAKPAPREQISSVHTTLKSVALSGDLAVVAMTTTLPNGSPGSAVVAFRRDEDDGAWRREDSLPQVTGIPEATVVSLAADHDLVVVAFDTGSEGRPVRVFRLDAYAGPWRKEAELTLPALWNGAAGGVRSVACDADTIVVGATAGGSGETYVFRRDREGGAWRLEARLGELLPGPAPNFGWRVAIDGDRICAGTDSIVEGGRDEWHLFEFDRQSASWTYSEVAREQDSGFGDFDYGCQALSGNTLIVGAPRHDAAGIDTGAAYVFNLP